MSDKLDYERFTDLTTWTPEKGPELKGMTTQKEGRVAKDHIDALFTASMWNK